MTTHAPPRHDAGGGQHAAPDINLGNEPQPRLPDAATTERTAGIDIMLTNAPQPRQPNAVDRIGMTPSGRRRRSDALPEHTSYQDKGCGGGCDRSLECPFERCRLDETLATRQRERARRDEAVVRARLQEGLPAPVIAERFNVAPRTVYRILQTSQEMTDAPPRNGRKAQTA